MPEVNSAWVALIAALLGGSGLKIIEYLLNRSKVRDDTATQIRKELREELTGLKEELRAAETALDEWKQKYYDLYDKLIQTRGELDSALRTIKEGQAQAAQALDNNPPPPVE